MMRVTAAVLEREGQILIARRRAGKHLAGKWEFPGGKIEEGESAEECLRRELREEFSIEAQIGDFLASRVHVYPEKAIELLAFQARYCGGEFVLSCHDAICWVTPEQLRDYDFAEADHFILDLLVSKGSCDGHPVADQ